MGRGTLGEVRDGARDPRGGLGRVRVPSGRSGALWGILGEVRKGWWTLEEVGDGPGDPQGGSGLVGGLSWRSGTVRWTLGEVRDGSTDPVKFRDG